MKKIAIISSGSTQPIPPVKGGAVENLVKFLLDENENVKKMDITVYSTYDDSAKRESGIYKKSKFVFIKFNQSIKEKLIFLSKVVTKICNRNINFDKLFINKVCKLIKKENYDYIVIENRSEYVLPIKKVSNTKVLLHIHNDYLNENSIKGRDIFENCYKVITVSEYIKKQVIKMDKDSENKVLVLKNCTDVYLFNKNLYKKFRKEFRNKHGISEDDIVILFSGRMHLTKGLKELILAFKKMNCNKCRLLVVGSSWYSDDRKTGYVDEIERLSIDIRDRIIFTGYVPFEDMPKIHSVADMSVVPSMWEEPAGLVVIEAMSSGLPLITTDSGGIPEYVDGSNVIVIKRDENFISNLSIQMKMLVNDEKKREKMAELSQKYVQRYNKSAYYNQFISIIGEENGK